MKRLAIFLAASTFLQVGPLGASQLLRGNNSRISQRVAYAPGELLVKYRPFVGAAASEHFRSCFGVSTLRRFKNVDIDQVKLPEGMTVEEALEIYRQDPDVEYAEPNYLRYATATIPDDTFFSTLWGLSNGSDKDIDAPEAWDLATGSDKLVVVAVLDSGVDYNHPDLAANIWTNPGEIPGNGNDDDGNGFIDDVNGWDFVDNDSNPVDNESHGTHVAGTIAAVGNNGIGITGVTWTAEIMVLRFLDGFGAGFVSDEVAAIDYAIAKGAQIINASFGSSSFSSAEREAITRAETAGILFVAAAGNDGENNDSTPQYPSNYALDNIIAVAASDQNDNLASFSDFGPTTVDVAAPGTSIYSAKPPDRTISVFSDNFEGGTGAWVLDPPWGLANNISFSGANSLADSPGQNYLNNTDVSARNDIAFNLSVKSRTRLTFKLKGESANNDLLFIETATNSGGPWTNRSVIIETSQTLKDGISGTSSGTWVNATVELDLLDGDDGYFHFRFQTNSDDINADGWYIDDVAISAADASYADAQSEYYQYLQGTSMATPHVAGLAALIWSQDLGQTYGQVKDRILNSVEVNSDLAGLLLTGGRINAFNSIRNVPAAPSSLSAKAASNSRVDLTWTDSSFGEDGFRIERRTGAGRVFAQIATTAANTTTYSDTGLQESTTYFYRISSFNGGNDSDYSVEKSATTRSASSSGGGDGGGGGGSGSGGGTCFIATAAYTSPLRDQFRILWDFRMLSIFLASCFFWRFLLIVCKQTRKRTNNLE